MSSYCSGVGSVYAAEWVVLERCEVGVEDYVGTD